MRRSRSSLFALLFVLAGCGGGSGAPTVATPVTEAPAPGNYTGPAPATADVQSFKRTLWDNLVPNNRCGACHDADQSPRFVRRDDINLAYQAAAGLVNLADPALSAMVSKVRGGHNCWLPEPNACADVIESYIENWAGGASGGAARAVELVAPPLRAPGASRRFPDSPGAFEITVYPLLVAHCAGCHTDGAAIPQSPYFASADPATAYAAAQDKMNLDEPADSRLVERLRDEFHNCWSASCSDDGEALEAAIAELADRVPTTSVDPGLVTSMALGLGDGIVSSTGGRHETNVIALYEFKTGAGALAYDTSGVEPALNLTLSGAYEWVGGWGVAFTDGKAQGATTASAKLHDLIQATGEFTLEAWIAPANVIQEGPARIVSYSGGPASRNFLLGQTQYRYDAAVRSNVTGPDGTPALTTDPEAQTLQATLQHVVLTVDPVNGRRLYVNGRFTGDLDPSPGGLLNDWDDTFALVIGSETNNASRWAGTVRLLAIHNRVLTEAQVQQNFEVGVGEKYYLLFNVSEHLRIPDAYVVFEVSQFDSHSYLFDEPFFVILDDAVAPGTIPVAGMRIGMNGRELRVGQAYATLATEITDTAYAFAGRQTLSPLGTVVGLERGPDQDEFFLSFEVLGDAVNVVTEPTPAVPAHAAPVPVELALGIRDFAEINATMARLTGVPASDDAVRATYELVHRSLPVQTRLDGFISSQQMGITQLAIKYCSVLVDDPARRAAFWPAFDFHAPLTTAFDDRSTLVEPILTRLIGNGLDSQPPHAEVALELDALITRLATCGGGCEADRVARVAKAACAAVLGSAAMLIQ